MIEAKTNNKKNKVPINFGVYLVNYTYKKKKKKNLLFW